MADSDERSLHQPHDKLFKAGFSDPESAAAFLSAELPPPLSRAVDWESLRLEPGSFIDSRFRNSESDLLFSASWQGVGGSPEGATGTGLFYLLFEHLSQPDGRIALRLLCYMQRIWEDFWRRHPGAEKLPIIMPVVLAQNARHWEIRTDFASLVHIPEHSAAEVRRHLPDFEFHLVQLADIPVESIPGTPSGILVLRVLRAERRNELLGDEVWDEALLEIVPRALFEMVLRYVLGSGDVDKTVFFHKVQEIHNAGLQQTAMTIAQQLHQEGRQEGLQEGHYEGQRALIIKLVDRRFGALPEAFAERLSLVADEAMLDEVFDLAFRAESLTALEGGLDALGL